MGGRQRQRPKKKKGVEEERRTECLAPLSTRGVVARRFARSRARRPNRNRVHDDDDNSPAASMRAYGARGRARRRWRRRPSVAGDLRAEREKERERERERDRERRGGTAGRFHHNRQNIRTKGATKPRARNRDGEARMMAAVAAALTAPRGR